MSSPTQTPIRAPGSASAEKSNLPWLVMVYMAGDNSLTEEMVLALQDLMLEGAPTATSSSPSSTRAARACPRNGSTSPRRSDGADHLEPTTARSSTCFSTRP